MLAPELSSVHCISYSTFVIACLAHHISYATSVHKPSDLCPLELSTVCCARYIILVMACLPCIIISFDMSADESSRSMLASELSTVYERRLGMEEALPLIREYAKHQKGGKVLLYPWK